MWHGTNSYILSTMSILIFIVYVCLSLIIYPNRPIMLSTFTTYSIYRILDDEGERAKVRTQFSGGDSEESI